MSNRDDEIIEIMAEAWDQEMRVQDELIDTLRSGDTHYEVARRVAYRSCMRAALDALRAAGMEVTTAFLIDSEWVSGATFGWNCGQHDNWKRLNAAVESRIQARVDATHTAREGLADTAPVTPEWLEETARAINHHYHLQAGRPCTTDCPKCALNEAAEALREANGRNTNLRKIIVEQDEQADRLSTELEAQRAITDRLAEQNRRLQRINLPIIDEDMWERLNETDLMTWNRHRGGPEWTQTAVDFVVELQRARVDTNPEDER